MRPWFAVAVAALGGVAAEMLAMRAGARVGSALLDLAAGWSLLGAAVVARSLAPGCRLMVGVAGALWFVGTLQVVEGDVGRVGELWGSLYAAPLAGALLSAPEAWPARRSERGLVGWLWLRGAVPALAGWNLGTLASGVLVAVAGLRTPQGLMSAVARRAAVVFGVVLAVAAGVRLAGASGGWVDEVLAVAVAGSGAALIVAGRQRPTATVVTSLVVDVGRLHDAGTLELRLAEALGDPRLRLLYRLGAGGAWLDSSGRSVSAPLGAAETVVTAVEVEGEVLAALTHEPGVLDDRALREAVLGSVRLAVVRLRLAADAVAQADELAASRRRLVEAAAEQRARFALDVREGPGVDLGRAAELLGAAVDSAPAAIAELLRAAAEQLADTRADLAAAVGADAGRILAEGGLELALARLAERAGASADLRLLDGPPVRADVATAAWYCVSEAVANALKHGGGARIGMVAHRSDGALVLEVSDDGPGGADPAGGGMAGMRERAAELGGGVAVESPPGGGTRVRIELPVECV